MDDDYRVHVSLRRRGQPAEEHIEFRTEEEGYDIEDIVTNISQRFTDWVSDKLTEMEGEND